jgi:hypothetical protein
MATEGLGVSTTTEGLGVSVGTEGLVVCEDMLGFDIRNEGFSPGAGFGAVATNFGRIAGTEGLETVLGLFSGGLTLELVVSELACTSDMPELLLSLSC